MKKSQALKPQIMLMLPQTKKLKTISQKATTLCTQSKLSKYNLKYVCSEIIDGKYIILKKLGWGHFSTVWLALKLSDKKLYALKVQKSADKYTESALEEEEILYDVASNYMKPAWEKSVRYYHKDP